MVQFIFATNVPGTDKHPVIQGMLRHLLHLDAPPCGPGARRETLFWQNFTDNEKIQQTFRSLPTPNTTVESRLRLAGITDWYTQPLVTGYNLPPLARQGPLQPARPPPDSPTQVRRLPEIPQVPPPQREAGTMPAHQQK